VGTDAHEKSNNPSIKQGGVLVNAPFAFLWGHVSPLHFLAPSSILIERESASVSAEHATRQAIKL
jgi:hypothetical protein